MVIKETSRVSDFIFISLFLLLFLLANQAKDNNVFTGFCYCNIIILPKLYNFNIFQKSKIAVLFEHDCRMNISIMKIEKFESGIYLIIRRGNIVIYSKRSAVYNHFASTN